MTTSDSLGSSRVRHRARLPFHDARLIAGTRSALAVAGLVAIYLVPDEPSRWVTLTYTTLILYVLFSIAVFALSALAPRLAAGLSPWEHWIDVAWFVLLIALSDGTNSIFFYGFYLPILAASFRWGFRSGLRVTAASAALFVIVGYTAAPAPPEFEGQRFVLRPLFLLALGYMIASRGGFELKIRRRLEFLRDVVKISNPRFGVDRTLGIVLHRLRDHYGAEAAVLVARAIDEGSVADTAAKPRPFICRVRRGEPEGSAPPEWISNVVAERFLPLPSGLVVAYGAHERVTAWPMESGDDAERASKAVGDLRSACESIASTLEAQTFLSVPLLSRGRQYGRLFLCFKTPRSFDVVDVEFLVQAVEQAFPLIDNIRLVNQLATGAAVEERRRIARDIHDSVIQPYVGIQMGLAAVRRSLEEGRDARADIDGLLVMSNGAIDELRRQVWSLREGKSFEGGLIPAVSRFAQRFSQVTGITVDVVPETDIRVEGPAATEVFQIVAEALSNIWRHTGATRAEIFVASHDGRLSVRVENDEAAGVSFTSFSPKSLRERAEAIGGRLEVSSRSPAGAVVHVDIPL